MGTILPRSKHLVLWWSQGKGTSFLNSPSWFHFTNKNEMMWALLDIFSNILNLFIFVPFSFCICSKVNYVLRSAVHTDPFSNSLPMDGSLWPWSLDPAALMALYWGVMGFLQGLTQAAEPVEIGTQGGVQSWLGPADPLRCLNASPKKK